MIQKRIRNWLSFLAVMALSGMLFAGCTQKPAEETTPSTEPTQTTEEVTTEETETEPLTEDPKGSAEEDSEAVHSYLSYYFDAGLTGDEVDAAAFNEALKKVAGEEAGAVEGDLTIGLAVKAAIVSADFEELALSYPDEKVTDRLKVHGITDTVEDGAYLACALDTGLVDEALAKKAAAGDALTTEEGEQLLMAVANVNGDGRNYLGYSNDPQIYAKLDNMWNSFILFDEPQLTNLGKSSVENGVTTGYNLKTSVYDARFLPELTMTYGHSSIEHAHQLVGLLNSENIVVKLQLEPKVSVYQYLLEWGPVPEEATPTYEVKQYSDELYLVHAVEYDLLIEFASKEDLLAFDSVIEKYAKKYEGNEEALGLISDSWWQPLYSTTIADMPEENYHQIYDCVVEKDGYSIHPFCLAENLDDVKTQFEAIDPELSVVPVTRYCNTAFYNYMRGEDYQ